MPYIPTWIARLSSPTWRHASSCQSIPTVQFGVSSIPAQLLPRFEGYRTLLFREDSEALHSVRHFTGELMTEPNSGIRRKWSFRLTSLRPGCPQIRDENAAWIKETFPSYACQPRELSWDDLRCTNLNITFPAFVLNNQQCQLPVMVYLHGTKEHFNVPASFS